MDVSSGSSAPSTQVDSLRSRLHTNRLDVRQFAYTKALDDSSGRIGNLCRERGTCPVVLDSKRQRHVLRLCQTPQDMLLEVLRIDQARRKRFGISVRPLHSMRIEGSYLTLPEVECGIAGTCKRDLFETHFRIHLRVSVFRHRDDLVAQILCCSMRFSNVALLCLMS